MKYYCHSCAVRVGIYNPIDTSSINLSGTDDQLKKYIKHTAPDEFYDIVSIYDDPTFEAYSNYAISPALSGCCEIDNRNRLNILWFAGKEIGLTYVNGDLQIDPNDTVKLVCSHNLRKVHHFPVTSGANLLTKSCEECGNEIVTG
ncbi:MAG: hypothetical protein OCC49_10395 [Fibrobacterales bacterium]